MSETESILPILDHTSTPWFEAIKAGKLLIQREPVTGATQFYPRAHFVGHPDQAVEWMEASGAATLYSFTVVKRSVHPQFRELTPFTIAIVQLAEGPRLTTWIVDLAEEELRCDMDLKLIFREINQGLMMPCFTKA